MKIVRDAISIEELKEMSQKMYGNLVKAVVDIAQEIMVVENQDIQKQIKIIVDKLVTK